MHSKTKKDLIYNTMYQVLVMILPFVTAPYISRVLGKYGMGLHTYTHSIAHYFFLFTMMGLANYGNRSIAKVRDDKERLNQMFSEIYSMQLSFAVIAIIAYMGAIAISKDEHRTLLIIQSLYVISAAFDVTWFYYGTERFKTIVTRNTIIKLLITASIFIFVKENGDIWKYSLIYALTFILSSFCLLITANRYVKFKWCSFKQFKQHIKPNVILFIPVIAISLYRIMDKIMIGALSSIEVTGLYESADKIVSLPVTITASVGTVMMPKMANMYAKGDDNHSLSLIRDSMQMIILLSCGLMFGMAAVSERFIPLYYGEDFADSAILVFSLSPILLFTSIASVIRTQYLIPKEKDRSYLVSVISGAVINLIINAMLIRPMGAMGAVIGTLVAEFSVLFIQAIAVRHDLQFGRYFADSWQGLVAGAFMFFCIKYAERIIPYSLPGIFLEVLFGAMLYGIVLLTLYLITNRSRLRHCLKLIGR